MKKRQFVLILLTAVVFLTCVTPALAARWNAENQNTAYCVALETNAALKHFEKEAYPEVLKAYKDSGVNVAAVCEENLAFDEEVISLAEDSGLLIALFLDGTCEKPASFYESLHALSKRHDIQYIGVINPKVQTRVPVLIADFLEQSDAALVVKEKISQLSNEEYIGYDEALRAAEGRIMRCYETWEEPAKTISAGNKQVDYADVLTHQMENSAKDRNTRFILVNQIISGMEDSFAQAKQTQAAIRSFCETMTESGYEMTALPDYTGYSPNRRVVSAGAVFIGVMMALFMVHVILKKNTALWDYLFLGIGVGAFGLTFFLPESLILLYPTVYAALASCFTLTLCAYVAEKLKTRPASPFWYTACMLVVALGILLFSGSVLLALLSGAEYYLNNLIFRGVKLTLVAPIGFAAVVMWLFYSRKSVKEQLASLPETVKNGLARIRVYHVVIVLLAGAAGVLYLMRSGNAGISLLENQIRNFLSDISGARPRTKEFLIGWPCFALWVYYLRKNSTLWKWIFGVAASLLFASATNTFCHVFTDGSISLLRTVNGLLFSLPVITVVSGGNALILKLIKQYKQ